MVGEGVFLVGAVTGNPLVMAIGVGVMAGVDAPSCAGGSKMGCVNLGLGAVALTAAAPGLSGALGPRLTSLVADESGSVTLGSSERPVGGVITGFTGHGVDQAITRGARPYEILDALSNPQRVLSGRGDVTRYIGQWAEVRVNSAGEAVTVIRFKAPAAP